MKNILLIAVLLFTFSCAEESSEKIYQGKLEELIVGEFSLKLDSLTKGVNNLKALKSGKQEYILITSSARKFKGWAFLFFSPTTGEEIERVEIPNEGPNSMKGGVFTHLVESPNRILAVNTTGEIGEYDKFGNKKLVYSVLKTYKDQVGFFPLSRSKSVAVLDKFKIQLGLNPNSFIKPKSVPRPGEMKSEFDVDFRHWIISLNLESGEISKSDFNIPTGYKAFKNDWTATTLFGDLDTKKKLFYLVWPGSEEIYVLDGVELKSKVIPVSNFEFNYKPTETIPWGDIYTVWALPKEASQNLFLIYDEHRDLILKATKINESGIGETKFERTKHYVLSIYSGDWQPFGEYLFDFENELDLENWFLTSEGLFINKPEQKSEDEYEFYKIDLSPFGNN